MPIKYIKKCVEIEIKVFYGYSEHWPLSPTDSYSRQNNAYYQKMTVQISVSTIKGSFLCKID